MPYKRSAIKTRDKGKYEPLENMMRVKQAILEIDVSICGIPSFADGFVNVYEIPSNFSINVISNQLMQERLNKTLPQWGRYEEQ